MSNTTARTGQRRAVGAFGAGRGTIGPSPTGEQCGSPTPLSTSSAPRLPFLAGFLAPDELPRREAGAVAALPAARGLLRRPRPRPPRAAGDQFAGVHEFPYRSWDLNRLAVHPDLVERPSVTSGRPSSTSTRSSCGASTPAPSTTTNRCTATTAATASSCPAREPLPTDHDVHLPLRRHRGRRPTRIVPYDDGKDVPFTPLFLNSESWPTAKCRRVGPRAHSSSTAPTSCIEVPISPGRPPASRSWSTSR